MLLWHWLAFLWKDTVSIFQIELGGVGSDFAPQHSWFVQHNWQEQHQQVHA